MLKGFTSALELATFAHEGQVRKNGDSYITHPIRVANFLKSLSMPTFVINAGYLHDTLEDSEVTDEEILNVSSIETLNIVKMLTKVSYSKKQTSNTGERLYDIDKYDNKIMEDFFATITKIADRIDNLNSIKDGNRAFKKKYLKETIDKYVIMADKLTELDTFDFKSYKCLSNEDYMNCQKAGIYAYENFSEALKNAQETIEERYCPITKQWYTIDEVYDLKRKDGIVISSEGVDYYLEHQDEICEDDYMKPLMDSINEFLADYGGDCGICEIEET